MARISSPSDDVDAAAIRSCHDAFRASVARFGTHPYLHEPRPDGAVELTYDQASERVAALQADYRRLGCGPGVRVGLMLGATAEFYLHFLALNGLGACIVPLHAEMGHDELVYLAGHSDIAGIVAAPSGLTRARAIGEALTPPVPAATPDRLDDLVAARLSDEPWPPGEDAQAAILYTSGTTGRPKGCVLTNAYFLSWGRWYLGLKGHARLRPGQERLITPLPTNHQNALACSFMGMTMSGGCVIQLERFQPRAWWRAVRDSRATIFHYLGVMPAMLLGMPEGPDDPTPGQLRFGLGAGVDPRRHAPFEARFGVPLLEGWAMTETGGVACVMSVEEPRQVGQRCIGHPPETLDYRIEAACGTPVALGEVGELLVRARGEDPRQSFFAGYLKDPEATAEAWRDGWFHTGDVVRADAAGLLYFVDRNKNIIRRSGENIAAIEVEGVLQSHPNVAACAVTAVADDIRGEEVMALVQPAVGSARDRAAALALQQLCLERMSYFKAPGHIAFVPELPVGATQKVKRAEVRALAEAALVGPDCFDLRTTKVRPGSGR